MEKFLSEGSRSKRQVISLALSTGILPKKEDFSKFFRSKHRSFWRLPNKQKHGHEEIYWGHGNIKISREWRDGKLEGLEIFYDRIDRSSRIKTNWKEGKMHGERFVFGATFTSEQFWKNGALVLSTSKDGLGQVTCKRMGSTEYIFYGGTLRSIFDRKTNRFWSFGQDGSVQRLQFAE